MSFNLIILEAILVAVNIASRIFTERYEVLIMVSNLEAQ